MIDTTFESQDPMPAWFAERMMTDEWSFGLMLVTGITVAIQAIDKITRAADGTLWLDVRLLPQGEIDGTWGAPTSRLTASINAAHVVMAFELADT